MKHDKKWRVEDEHHLMAADMRISYYRSMRGTALRVSSLSGSSLFVADVTAPGGWQHVAGRRRVA